MVEKNYIADNPQAVHARVQVFRPNGRSAYDNSRRNAKTTHGIGLRDRRISVDDLPLRVTLRAVPLIHLFCKGQWDETLALALALALAFACA